MRGAFIQGRLATGIGQGRHFTQLDWARRQFMEKVGIAPYPGTVNIVVDDANDVSTWLQVKSEPGVRIDNPNDGPHDCDARCYRVLIEGRIEAAIVVPEVEGYAPGLIEMIAAVNVRETLGIADGDVLRLEIR